MTVGETMRANFLMCFLAVSLLFSCSDAKPSEQESVSGNETQSSQDVTDTPLRPKESEPKPVADRILDVMVIDGESEASVKGASIYLISDFLETDKHHFAGVGMDEPWTSRIADENLVGTTDAKGQSSFSIPQHGFYRVVVRHGEKLGDATIEVSCAISLTIPIKKDRPMRVQVVDAAGTPVPNVSVGLAATKADPRMLGVRLTDAKGWVEYKHPKRWLQPWARSKFDNIIVGISEVFDPPVRVLVSGFDSPGKVVLPPFGSITLKTEPATGDSVFHLALKSKRKRLVLSTRPGVLGRTERKQRAGESTLRFPCVGLDFDLRVQKQSSGLAYEACHALRGPGMSGQEIEFQVKKSAESTVIPCRIVNIKGDPLGSARVSVRMAAEGARPNRFVVETNEDGRCSVPFVHAQDPATTNKSPTLPSDININLLADGFLQRYQRNFMETWKDGEFLVTLIPKQLIAAGVVKDGLGKPLADVQVHLELLRKSGYHTHSVGRPIVTDQNGRFAIHAGKYQGIYRIATQRFDHENAFTSHIELGVDDLEIRMEKKGRVLGELHVDDVLDGKGLIALFRERGEQTEMAFPFRRIGKGKYSLDSAFMVPGIYDFVVVQNDVGGRLHRISELRIPFRGDQDPKELNPLDLTKKFRDLTIYAVDENDKPLLYRFVELSSPEADSLSYRQIRGTDHQGRVRFVAPKGPLEATVTLDKENNFKAVIDANVPKQTIRQTK